MKPQKGRQLIAHENRVLCKLYNTVVADIDLASKTIRLNTGGYNTMSTVNAMNAAFAEANINYKVRAYRKQHIVYVDLNGHEYEVIDKLVYSYKSISESLLVSV